MSDKIKNVRYALVAILLLFCAVVQAQTVKGVVKDDAGETVIGATVQEQGTKNGVVTDIDGKFSITLKGKSHKLVVSYVGMKTKTVDVKDQSKVTIKLEDDNNTLEDLVVVGYGTMKKKDLTGSIATVGSKALEAVPVANASEALTGKMAGVQVTTVEGSPDADVKIRVRGGGSITQSNDPLYIVDGFPVESINDIPASDIEDITALKDASSTAIYGSRGANGVILVTTKSGKAGKVNVSYNAYYSWKKLAKKLDVLDAYDYTKWQYELILLKNQGDLTKMSNYEDQFGGYQDLDLYQNIPTNDWMDIVYGRTGHTFNQNININGGSDEIKYSFSYAHMNDKAIQIGSSFKRDNFSLKLNTKPSKVTTLDFQARYVDTDVRGSGANEATSTYDSDKRLKYAMLYPPFPVKNVNSAEASGDDDIGNLFNPIDAQKDNDRKKERKNLNISAAFGWNIIKNLKFKAEMGYDDYTQFEQTFKGTTTYYAKNIPEKENKGLPLIRNIDTKRHRFRSTNTINYDFKKLFDKNSKHSLNLLAGHEYVITKQHDITDEAHGFPRDFDAETAWKVSIIGKPYSINDFYKTEDKLLSYFSRISYNYDEKYLFNATFRADGSSKFSSNNRWGYFPSAALAWRISSEDFMKSAEKWLDDLKLRVSFGTSGNNNIPGDQLIQSFNVNKTTWVNNVDNYIAASKIMANPDLKWETTITRNVGLDFTLFHSKLSGTLEAYLSNTKDLLIEFPVGGSGYDYQYRNMGETENKGFEVTISWHAVNKKDFGLDFNANIGFNRNKIKSLGIMKDFGMDTRWASTEIGQDYWIAVGGQVGEIRGYKNAGRYEVDDFEGYNESTKSWTLKPGVVESSYAVGDIRPGTMKIASTTQHWDEAQGAWVWNSTGQTTDANGKTATGKISDDDNTIIGNVNPDFTGGFGLNIRAYGFDLAANFNFSVGNDIYNANKIEYTSTSKYSYRNMITDMAEGKRWTNLNADGTLCNNLEQLKAMNANTTMWSPYMKSFVLTDWAIEDASFLRLNTLTLGYTLPKSLTMKAHISSLRFYVTGYNVFTLTNYSGFDPESDCIRRNALTPGVDYSGYPRSRQFVFGLNLNF